MKDNPVVIAEGSSGDILSSIHINGISDYYGSADCAVFGFKYQEPQGVSGETLRIPIGWNGA